MRVVILSLMIVISAWQSLQCQPGPIAIMALEIRTMNDPELETILVGNSLSPLRTLANHLTPLTISNEQYPILVKLISLLSIKKFTSLSKKLVLAALDEAALFLTNEHHQIIDENELKTIAYIIESCKDNLTLKPTNRNGIYIPETRTNDSIILKASGSATNYVSLVPDGNVISINQSLSTSDSPAFAGLLLRDTEPTPKTVTLTSTATITPSSYTLTFPAALPATSNSALTSNTSGTLSWTNISSSGAYWMIGGNHVTSGAAVLGTDATSTQDINIQTNGTTRLAIANSTGIITASPALYANGGVDVTSGTLSLGTTNASTVTVGGLSTSQDINIGVGTGGGTINIATGTGVATVNIGASSDTVNIGGTLTWVKTTDLQVTDKLITINKGGTAGSASGAGIQVEENALITGSIKTSSDRKSWQMVAPAQAYTATIQPVGANLTIASPATASYFAGTGTVNVAASGINNTGIGSNAGGGITSGTDNTCLGYNAGSSYTTEANNICIGSGVTGTAADANTIRIGNATNASAYITGIDGVSVGTTGDLMGITASGAKLGTSATNWNLTGNLILGASTIVYDGSTSFPYFHHSGPSSPVTNIFAGDNAGNTSVSGGSNTGFGVGALMALTTGIANTALGRDTGVYLLSGSNNTLIGYNAGSAYTSNESENICIGGNVTGTVGENYAIRIGNNKNTAVYIYGIDNVSVGTNGNLMGVTASGIKLGTKATNWTLTGNQTITNASTFSALRLSGNTGGTLSDWTLLSGFGSTNNFSILQEGVDTEVAINSSGHIAFGPGISPDSTYILKVAGSSGGYGSIMIGDASAGNAILRTVSGSPDYLNIGFTGSGSQLDTLRVTRTGDLSVNDSTIIYRGGSTPYIHHTGPTSPILNIFAGDNAGNTSVTGGDNAGFGVGALYQLTSGTRNTACGRAALQELTGGNTNVAVGYQALLSCTSGPGNTCVGGDCGTNITTGAYNTLLGIYAGTNYTTESSNICIANAGIASDASVIRIGAAQAACFISGIYNVHSVPSGLAMYCGSNDQLATASSSQRFKENIKEIPSDKRASDLHPVSFNYKDSPDKELWYGLIAEEVEPIMPELVVKDKENLPYAVKYQHIPILLLKEVQEMRATIKELQARLAALETK